MDINCKVVAYPKFAITTKPTHGTVEVKKQQVVVASLTPGNPIAHCNGLRVSGVAIVYKSTNGFVGSDIVKYNKTVGSGVMYSSSKITVVK